MFIETIREFLKDRFNLYLSIALILLGVLLLIQSQAAQTPVSGKLVVNFFYLPTCPHCAEQKPIINELQQEFGGVEFRFHDASTPEGSQLFYQMASEAGMDPTKLAVPTTFIGKHPLVGVHTKEAMRVAIDDCQDNCVSGWNGSGQSQGAEQGLKEFDVPFLGRMDLASVSLPVLAVVLGLVDGFNPCAMWVLVYLIALLINVNDRKKVWIIVGSFVLSSGVLYFLFMTAWLNAFLLLGYMRALTIAIGIAALGGGILSIKEYITTKDALTCKVGDESSHEKTIKKMENIVAMPLSVGVILAIIALAFVVNSVEFVCSSAIPAIFTQVLALSKLSTWEYYLYICVYVFFFMLDDLIIFGLAALAINTTFGNKYAKYCKIIGGVILFILGIMLLFAPQMLR